MSVTGDSVPYSSPPLSVHVMCQDSAHPAQPQAWFTWASSSNQTPDLDSLLEEACVRCFNLLKLMGKKPIIKQVNVGASSVSQMWLLQQTKLQHSIDLTEPLLQ